MAMSAKYEPFNGNGDVSIWVKNSQVEQKTPKQTNESSFELKVSKTVVQ